MEYIAKAKCGVDSSFPTDRSDRNIVVGFVWVFFFFLRPGSLIYESMFFINRGRCS